jgi:hypothetical protein
MADLTRAWDEWLANVAEFFGLSIYAMVVISVFLAIVVALGWYFWPAWLPWRWSWSRRSGSRERRGRRDPGRRRLGRLRWRWRWRRRRRGQDEEPEPLADDQVPDLPAEVLALTADQLAATGRYAEAVRERLRSMLRGLIERDLLPASPGWTVMELAAAGARVRPALSSPLGSAARLFSDIWYGLRPATVADDAAMRGYADEVAAVAAAPEPATAPAGRPM